MTKKQFLDSLETQLRQHKVADIDDVLADYDAHFTRKALDGYTEEEIAHKLGTPEEIACDFLPENDRPVTEGAAKGHVLKRIGLCVCDIVALVVFIVLFAWAIAVFAGSIGLFALGVYLGLGLDLLSFIPVLTVAGGILMGIGTAALSILILMGSLWFWMLAAQMMRAYMRWHGNGWFGRHELSLPVMPQLTGKKRRIFRTITLTALISFILLFVAGFILLSIQAGTPEFWHHWHWFEPVEEIGILPHP